MARLRGPLVSFSAHGKLAGALSLAAPRNRPQAREYTTPANPRTPAQIAHRAIVAQAVATWQALVTLPEHHDGWNLLAKHNRMPMTGYAAWIKNTVPGVQITDQVMYATGFGAWAADQLNIFMVAPFFIGPPVEPGLFNVTFGLTPDSMTYAEQVPVNVGWLAVDTTTYPETTMYFNVKKDGLFRSGIAYRVET